VAKTTVDAFNEFKAKLVLTDNQRQAIDARRDATINYVKTAFPPASDLPFKAGTLIGSASRGTIIRPLDDIDLMATFTNKDNVFEKYRSDSQAFLYRIRDKLKESSRVEVVGARGQVVRFFYKDAPHIDIAPMFKWNGDGYALPEGTGGWITTDPHFHADYFSKRDAELDSRLKPMMRMLKRWNRVHSRYFKSFHLEVIVSAAFGSIGNDSRAACEKFFEWAPKHLEVKDPAGHSGVLSTYLTSNMQGSVLKILESARERAANANHAELKGDHAEAIRLWRITFGDEFPAYG
jgi:hypothetical protein